MLQSWKLIGGDMRNMHKKRFFANIFFVERMGTRLIFLLVSSQGPFDVRSYDLRLHEKYKEIYIGKPFNFKYIYI